MTSSMPDGLPPRARSDSACTAGFTLIELLVVIGIMALLLALLMLALARSRALAKATLCSSQLRELGRAAHLYAQDNHQYIPRDCTGWQADRWPYWMIQLGPYVDEHAPWEQALEDAAIGDVMVQELDLFNCPEHQLAGEIPGTYIVNAFRFSTDPNWDPAGPVKLSAVRNGSAVAWVAEGVELFEYGQPSWINGMYLRELHDAWRPEHLPGARAVGLEPPRITDRAHLESSNVLFFDTSVQRIDRGGITLEMFDDGIRHITSPFIFGDS